MQDRPSLALASAGILIWPFAIAAFAAAKNACALQNENWPNIEPWAPLVQWARRTLLPWERRVRLPPLNPNQMPTTAFAGRVGTTCGAAGPAPRSTTSG